MVTDGSKCFACDAGDAGLLCWQGLRRSNKNSLLALSPNAIYFIVEQHKPFGIGSHPPIKPVRRAAYRLF